MLCNIIHCIYFRQKTFCIYILQVFIATCFGLSDIIKYCYLVAPSPRWPTL
jgi:hypothetical protein